MRSVQNAKELARLLAKYAKPPASGRPRRKVPDENRNRRLIRSAARRRNRLHTSLPARRRPAEIAFPAWPRSASPDLRTICGGTLFDIALEGQGQPRRGPWGGEPPWPKRAPCRTRE